MISLRNYKKVLFGVLAVGAMLATSMVGTYSMVASAEDEPDYSYIEDWVYSDDYDTGFTRYYLSWDELVQIASLCRREQGTPEGAAAEASLMANRYELHGGNYSSLCDYVKYCRWFAHSISYMERRDAPLDVIEAVKQVLVYGKRTLPAYIDEHDYLGDITRSFNQSTGKSINKYDRKQYRPYDTYLNNKYSGGWTFYDFPTATSDPFGYTSEGNREAYGGYYYDFETGERVDESAAILGIELGENEGAGPTILEGDYLIKSLLGEGYYLDISGTERIEGVEKNVQMYHLDPYPNDTDIWTVKYNGNGYYTISQKGTDACLDVSGASLEMGANVQVSPRNGTVAQDWSIVSTGDGYLLQSRCNSFYLDVSTGLEENCTNVDIYGETGNTDQKWAMIPYNKNKVFDSGRYYIKKTEKVPDETGGTKNVAHYLNIDTLSISDKEDERKSANILYDKDGLYKIGDKQVEFIKTDNDRYYIVYRDNGQYLEYGDTTATRNLCNGADSEKWEIIQLGISKIEIEKLPSKTVYKQGEKELDLKDLVVKITYTDGNTEEIGGDRLKAKYDFSEKGDSVVKLTYTFGKSTKTISYRVKVE